MSNDRGKKAVGYVLKKFPVLSETFILNEILELEAKGTLVHIFSLERPNDPRFHEKLSKLKANITYIPDVTEMNVLWKHAIRSAKSYRKFYKKAFIYALTQGKADLLWRFLQGCYVANSAKRFGVRHFHAHFATRPTTVAFFASLITDLPFSFTAHAMDIYKNHLSTKSLRKKMKKARFVVTVSDYNRKHLLQVGDGNSNKIVRIYNGIGLEQFQPNGECKSSIFTFICVARFVEKKGHQVLIEACRILHKRGIKFECLLVGKGNLRSQIRVNIKKKKLYKYVKLLGPLSQVEVAECYRNAHAYVLPCIMGSDGNRDGLPVSIVEALASGLPVITTPMTGNPEVVQANHNGLLVPFSDSSALADAMERLIKDSNFYHHLKKNARDSVVTRFDIHQTTETLNNLYAETLL